MKERATSSEKRAAVVQLKPDTTAAVVSAFRRTRVLGTRNTELGPAWASAAILGALLTMAPAARASDTARLPEPAYPSVVRLVKANKPVEALAELDRQLRGHESNAPPEALALRAELLRQAGRPRESAAVWDELADREPALAARASRRAIEALLAAGDANAALTQLGAPSARARRNDDLFLQAVSVLRSTGEARRAEDLATKILAFHRRGPLADAALLEQAASLEAAGDLVGAIGALRRAKRTFSDPRTFTRAHDEERRLAGTLGRRPAPFTEAEYRAIARRLAGASRFAEANDVLMDWLRAYPTSASLADIDAAVIENLYRLRANDEARSAIDGFVRQHRLSPRMGRVRVIQFRLDVREGRTDDVKARGRELWEGRGAILTAAERWTVGVALANYLVSVGEVDEALSIYKALYPKASTRARRIDVLLRAAVAALRADQPKRAETNLRSLLALRPRPATAQAATYWLAVAKDRLGVRDEAIALLQHLAAGAPYGYSGVRAAEALRRLGAEPRPARPISFPDPSLQPATERLHEYRAATILARAGLRQDAAAAARELATKARRDPAAALLAARASGAAGEHGAALRMLTGRLSPYLQRPAGGAPDDLLTLAYPRAFWDEVRPRAEKQGVDPLLLVAIMRRESRFDPTAISPVGATGLFQIMPYTAEELAPEAGVDAADDEALLRPPANTAIAATLVSNLSRLFGAAVVPTVAAFNAGEDRVKVWWDAARGVPEDLFVETIPYAETRAYVKEVHANYVMYRKLYGR